ncbi:MAG: hypothetical protein H7070_06060 [Saprospiraceae bacterium]|nr:hypothetical protein [Pyrinomonadaceae bacterium]
MKVIIKNVGLFALLALATFSVSAQSDDIYRGEIFAGYSYLNIDSTLSEDDFEDFGDIDSRLGTHGVNVSGTGNFTKFVGAKFDFSSNGKTEDISEFGATGLVKYRVNQFLGGVQFKNNKKDGPTFKPFAHVLAGVSRQTIKFEGVGFSGGPVFSAPTGDITFEDDQIGTNNFAIAIGGGLDVKVHKNVDVRVFQVDYNPTFFRAQDFGDGFIIPGRTQNNVRFSFGVVFH